jgi:hypothetical protein
MSLLFAAVTAAARNRRVVEPPVEGASITLSGNDISSVETGFRDEVSSVSAEGPWTTLGSRAALSGIGSAYSATYTGQSFNTRLWVRTVPFNGVGDGHPYDALELVTRPELAVDDLSVVATTGSTLLLGWTYAADPLDGGFRIEQLVGAEWVAAGTVSESVRDFVVTDLDPLTEYSVRVIPFNRYGSPEVTSNAAASNVVTGETLEAEGWTDPVAVSSGESVVFTVGSLVEAVNLGEAVNRTINGVTFVGVASRDDFESSAVISDLYLDGGLDGAFTDFMRSVAYAATEGLVKTITVDGLTIGERYLVQVFLSDDRSGYLGTRTQYYTVEGHVSTAPAFNTSYTMVCYFYATATSTDIVVTNTNGTLLQGFQVRLLS